MKELLSVILSIPVLVFGFFYIFLWIVPLDIIKQRKNRKEPYVKHPLPIQNLIDKVKEEMR
jgi:hypothetical protein